MGEHVPLTAGFIEVEEGIDDTAEAHHTRRTKMLTDIHERSNEIPFCITHIRRIVGGSCTLVAHTALHRSRRPVCTRIYHSRSILC
jgi:hypothetical protein